ncbi:MAG: aminotransferase class V-fold PLP-dependent enzyme [Anaerolineales bacterium]|nr:aminotransferase class V-fold PLP-dependent enzyme [Anaerolineales bacterium]
MIYTSNTTEAINLVAESLHNEADPAVEPVVINTFLEHNSNELPWRTTAGSSLVRLSIDQDGFIDLQELEAQLRAFNVNHEHGKQRIQLVAVSGASNVLGIFNDLAAIGATVHRYGARFLVDAAQLVAHRPVDMVQCEIDYLVFSAHKAYAPFGAGVLVARKGMLQFDSPTWAQVRASGEANVGGIAALGKALVLLNRIGLELIQTDEQALTAQALRGMAQIPELTVFGVKDPEAPAFAQKGGVIPFNVKDLMAESCRRIGAAGGLGCAQDVIAPI